MEYSDYNNFNIIYMNTKKLLYPLLMLSLSSCIGDVDFDKDFEVQAKEVPSIVAPAAYGSYNIKDLITRSDKEKKELLKVNNDGTLKLSKTFSSLYRENLLNIVQPKEKDVNAKFSFALGNFAGMPISPSLIPQGGLKLMPKKDKIEIELPEQVRSLDKINLSCTLDISLSDLPVDMSYIIEFDEITDGNDQPIRFEWNTKDNPGKIQKDFPVVILKNKTGNKLSLNYSITPTILSVKENLAILPANIMMDISLSNIEIQRFEGVIHNNLELTHSEPISFAYEEWDKIKDLSIWGSSIYLDLSYQGKLNFTVSTDLNLKNKNNSKINPTIPIDLNSIAKKEQKVFTYNITNLDDILKNISKDGLSVNTTTIDFNNSKVILDKNSFIDLSLTIDLPLKFKFTSYPLDFKIAAPLINFDIDQYVVDNKLLKNLYLELNSKSTLPISFVIKSLVLTDSNSKSIKDGNIPVNIDIKYSKDGKKLEISNNKIDIDLEKLKLLQKADSIQFIGEIKSSGDWVEFREEQYLNLSSAISINK